MRYLYSLIIPYHNPKIDDVKRTFDSLRNQGSEIDKVQIIAVDDNSDSLEYRNYISENYKELNVIFRSTVTNCHCPGNTRKEGMKHISGEYVFFCDQDDYFENDILSKVTEFIFSFPTKPYVISTIMWSYDQEKDEYVNEYAHKQTWLHGKWYNVDDFIYKYKIDFKENLKTHEDVYFNSCVIAELLNIHSTYSYLDINTYRWVNNPESLTRQERIDRGYLYENFQDYITSAAEPYWDKASKNEEFKNQIMMTLMHSYFYYEAASYYEGPKQYSDIAKMIENFIKAIVNEFNYTLDDIVNYLYSNPIKYKLVLDDCRQSSGLFIPKTSLRDFVYYLGKR